MGKGSRVNRKGRSSGGGQFFKLYYQMARSAAFRSLSGSALKVFIELRCRFNGHNNGDLSVSLGECAGMLRMSKSTAARAFRELEAKGFIFNTSPGNWYGRKAATWAVTCEKQDLPRPEIQARNTWKHWQCERIADASKNSERGTETARKAA